MIRDAKEAREIIFTLEQKHPCFLDPNKKSFGIRWQDVVDFGVAKSYLAALEGPECKALVASGLAAVAQLVVADEEYTKATGGAILVDTKKALRDWKVALEKYQEAVNP